MNHNRKCRTSGYDCRRHLSTDLWQCHCHKSIVKCPTTAILRPPQPTQFDIKTDARYIQHTSQGKPVKSERYQYSHRVDNVPPVAWWLISKQRLRTNKQFASKLSQCAPPIPNTYSNKPCALTIHQYRTCPHNNHAQTRGLQTTRTCGSPVERCPVGPGARMAEGIL